MFPYGHDLNVDEGPQVHERSDALIEAERYDEAVRILIEDGQYGLAFLVVTMHDGKRIPDSQKRDIVRMFAVDVDVEHAKRLASKWCILRTLDDEVLKLFERGR